MQGLYSVSLADVLDDFRTHTDDEVVEEIVKRYQVKLDHSDSSSHYMSLMPCLNLDVLFQVRLPGEAIPSTLGAVLKRVLLLRSNREAALAFAGFKPDAATQPLGTDPPKPSGNTQDALPESRKAGMKRKRQSLQVSQTSMRLMECIMLFTIPATFRHGKIAITFVPAGCPA